MTADERSRPDARAAADQGDASEPTETAGKPVRERVVSDARTMRALAHPVRIALLEAIGREGELTATHAADMLDESPGNMSWHLQTLAKYGYVEEAGGGKGRSRPWRLASVSQRFTRMPEDPQAAAAGDALVSTFAEEAYSRLRTWITQRASYPQQWREAAFAVNALTYLTADEMSALRDEVSALFGRYQDRIVDRQLRPADAEPVKLVAFGHPIPPTPTGN